MPYIHKIKLFYNRYLKEFLKDVSCFLLFIVEESPTILGFISIPALLGILAAHQQISTIVTIGIAGWIGVYLRVKSKKYLKNKKVSKVWMLLLIFSALLSLAISIIVSSAMMVTANFTIKGKF